MSSSHQFIYIYVLTNESIIVKINSKVYMATKVYLVKGKNVNVVIVYKVCKDLILAIHKIYLRYIDKVLFYNLVSEK